MGYSLFLFFTWILLQIEIFQYIKTFYFFYKLNDQLTVSDQPGEYQGKETIVTMAVMENGNDNITVTTFTVKDDS